MADLQTIYYRIKLDSKSFDTEKLPIEAALKKLYELRQGLMDNGAASSDPLLKSYNRQIRTLEDLRRQNRDWYKDVASLVDKLADVSVKELQAALKQTQKEWRDIANSGTADTQRVEELRRRETLITEELEKRDLRRRSFAADFLKLNELTTRQLQEGARQSKAMLDTLPKGSEEMKKMLAYATGYANRLKMAQGGMSIGKAFEMGSNADKSQRTIGELNEGMQLLQGYVKDFGQYMDDGVVANYNKRIDQIRKRTQDAARLIAETGQLPSGERANIKQMEEAQRVLLDWQQTADATVQKSVATWLANITRMVKEAKSAVASAADGNVADEARALLQRSKTGSPDVSAEAKAAREEGERAQRARIDEAKAEVAHRSALAEIEHKHTIDLRDAHIAHQQNLADATLEELAAKRTAEAHADAITSYNNLVEQQKKAAADQAAADELKRQHENESAARREEVKAKDEQIAATRQKIADLEYSTTEGYRKGLEERAQAEQTLQSLQDKQKEAMAVVLDIEQQQQQAADAKVDALNKQQNLLSDIAANERQIKELEKPVQVTKNDGMVSAASLYAPDEAMRQAFNRKSRSKQLSGFLYGMGESLSEHLGNDVSEDTAKEFASNFLKKVKQELRTGMPATADATRAAVANALSGVVKQMKLTDDQAANLNTALANVSNSMMEDLLRTSRSSTSAISYVMRQTRQLSEQEKKDMMDYANLVDSTDKKVQKRLSDLKVHLRQLVMTGLTNLANEGGIPANSLKAIGDKVNKGEVDKQILNFTRIQTENKELEKMFQEVVRKSMSNAFDKQDADLANKFFAQFKSAVVGSLRRGVPDLADEMKPMMFSLLNEVFKEVEMTSEQAAKVIQSFEDQVKNGALRDMREFALGMRRNTMGGNNPDGMSLDEQWERMIDRLEGTPESKQSGRRERRDRKPIGAAPAAKYSVGDMLTGMGWREGGLAAEFKANGGAVNEVIQSMRRADELLVRIMRNLKDDAPESLKQVKRYVEDMMRYVTVDMQKMIEQNGGKLPKAVSDRLHDMMSLVNEQMVDVMHLGDSKQQGGAFRNNNGLMANIKSMQLSLVNAFSEMFKGTQGSLGKVLSSFIKEDEFAKGFAQLIRENKPASRDDMLKQLADYLREYTAKAVESKKISGEAVEQAVNHIQSMAEKKTVSRIMQIINAGEKSPLYDKSKVDQISEGLNKQLSVSTDAMQAALKGTDTKNPFTSLIETLTEKGGPTRLINALTESIVKYQKTLNTPGYVDNDGIGQSIEKMKMAREVIDGIGQELSKAGPDADVFTVAVKHIDTLLGKRDKLLSDMKDEKERLEMNLADNIESGTDSDTDRRLAQEANTRYQIASQFYDTLAETKSRLIEKQKEETRLQQEAEEQQQKNIATAQKLREENEAAAKQIEAEKQNEQDAAKQEAELANAHVEAKANAEKATQAFTNQANEVQRISDVLNQVENSSRAAFETTRIESFRKQIEEIDKKERDLADARKSMEQVNVVRERGAETKEEEALLRKASEYEKIITENEGKQVEWKRQRASLERQISASQVLSTAAGKGDEEWAASMENYIKSLNDEIGQLNKKRRKASADEKAEIDAQIADRNKLIDINQKELDTYRERSKQRAAEIQQLKEKQQEQERERVIANQAANEEARLAKAAEQRSQRASTRQQDLQQSIDEMQEANRVAIEAQRRYQEAKQNLADLRAVDPTQQANADYQAAVAAEEQKLAAAREEARAATEREQQAMENYTAAISKNGGVSIAHLRQMRENVKYLKENVEDSEAIERYGELLAELDKRIAELDSAPLRKAADVIADADDLLTRPASRPDTTAEQAAVAAAKQNANDERERLQYAEQLHGQRMQNLEEEWAVENRNRQHHAELRAAEESKVAAAREAVRAADKQSFIDEQNQLKAEAEATKAELEAQQQEIDNKRQQNDLDRQNAGYKKEADKAESEMAAIREKVYLDQKEHNSEVVDAQVIINEAEKEQNRLEAERLAIKRRLKEQADAEIETLKKELAIENDENKRATLNKRITRLTEKGTPENYSSAYYQSDDYLWREGSTNIKNAQDAIIAQEKKRQEIHADREKLSGTHLLINEKNNREALDKWKSFVDEYVKVLVDNKSRMETIGIDPEHTFMSEQFLGQLRAKWQKIFESVRYNTDATFRAQMNEMMRDDLKTMGELVKNMTANVNGELTTEGAKRLAQSAKDHLEHNLHIWTVTPDSDVYAKFGEDAESTQKKVEETHKRGKKAAKEHTDELKQQQKEVVTLTDEQKKLVDQYYDLQQKAKEASARVQARADYKEITDAAKSAKGTKKDERTDEQNAAIQRQDEMWAEKNALTEQQRAIYKQLKESGFDMNTQQAEYVEKKREELGLTRQINEEKKKGDKEAPADDSNKAEEDKKKAEEDQKKAEAEQKKAEKKQRQNEEKERKLNERERKVNDEIDKSYAKIDKVQDARDYNRSVSRLVEIEDRINKLKEDIKKAPKANEDYQAVAQAEEKVRKSEEQGRREKGPASAHREMSAETARAIAEARVEYQKALDAYVTSHATEEQKIQLDALNKQKQEAIAKDKEFADADAALATEQKQVTDQLQQTQDSINNYTTAIAQAQAALQNLDKAQENLQKAEQKLAEWDAANPYEASMTDDDYNTRRQHLEDELSLARQKHEAAMQEVADTQATLRAAEQRGAASIKQLRESYAETQKSFEASNDQGERDALSQRMANLKALIDKLNVEPVREFSAVIDDVSKANNIQRLTLLRQELQRIVATTDDDSIRDSALTEIDNLSRRLEKMNITPLRSFQQIQQDLAESKSAASVKKLTDELQDLANRGEHTKDELRQINDELFKQQQRYKDMTSVSFNDSQVEEVLTKVRDVRNTPGGIGKANNGVVRDLIAQIEVARKSNEISVEKSQELADAQKELQDALAASKKSYMSASDAEKIYRKGIQASTSEIQKAIEGIDHEMQRTDLTPARYQELQQMLDSLKRTMQGDGYDKDWLDNIFGDKGKDLSKAKVHDLERALRMLREEIRQTTDRAGGNAKKFAEMQQRADMLEREIKQASGSFNDMNDALSHQSDWLTTNIKKLASYLGVFGGFYMVRQQFQRFFQESMKYDDQLTDIRKTTDLTESSIHLLADSVKAVDTRTTVEQLQNLAYAAGKLGVKSVSDIMGFVRAADKLNVSLGEQLGGDAAEKLMKISNIMGDVTAYGLEEALTRTGSAITYLAKNSAASGDAIVAFMSRTAGISRQAGVTTSELAGLAAAISALNQPAEMSATSFSKMMVQMEKSYKTVGKALKMTDEEMETMRLDLETGHGMDAFLDMLRRVKEMGGLSQTAQISKDLGSEGNRVIQTLTTLASSYDIIEKMVRQSTSAFEDNMTVEDEYIKKNTNVAALYERLRNNFAKLFIDNDANEWLRSLLEKLQGLPDAVQHLIDNFRPIVSFFGNILVDNIHGVVRALTWLFTVMGAKAVIVNLVNGLNTVSKGLMTLGTIARTNTIPQVRALDIAIANASTGIERLSLRTSRFFAIMRTASIGNIFTFLVTIIGTVVSLLYKANDAITQFGDSAEKSVARVNQAADETTDKMEEMLKKLNDTNIAEEENLKLRQALQEMYKDYLGNLNLETMAYEELERAVRAANDQLRAKQILDATKSVVSDTQTRAIQDQSEMSGKLLKAILSGLAEESETYTEEMRNADAKRIRAELLKNPEKYLKKNKDGEYDGFDSRSMYSQMLKAMKEIVGEEKIAQYNQYYGFRVQDALAPLLNAREKTQQQIENAEDYGEDQAREYVASFMKEAEDRMEHQWDLLDDYVERRGKEDGNGEFDAETKRKQRTDGKNNATTDDWARDKRDMDDDVRNAQIEAADAWLADARVYIEDMKLMHRSTEDILKMQNKINNVAEYRRIMALGVTDQDDKDDDKNSRKQGQEEYRNIIAKIEEYYKIQATQLEKDMLDGKMTKFAYEDAIKENEKQLNLSLASVRDAIDGDDKGEAAWSARLAQMIAANIGGAFGDEVLERIKATGSLRQIGLKLNAGSKEDRAVISGMKKEADSNRMVARRVDVERYEKTLSAMLEQNVLGKIAQEFQRQFEELGLIVNIKPEFNVDGVEIRNLTQVEDDLMSQMYQIGKNIAAFDMSDIGGMEAFRSYITNVALFPDVAKTAVVETDEDIKAFYYKVYEYAEQYQEQVTKLVQKSESMWGRMFQQAQVAIDERIKTFNIDELQKANDYLQKWGLSGSVNYEQEVEYRKQNLALAQEEWAFMKKKAAEKLAAANAMDDSDPEKKKNVDVAESLVKDLEIEPQFLLDAMGKLNDSMLKLRENTWGWTADLEKNFEQFGNNIFALQSWYDINMKHNSVWTNAFGSKADRQKAFAAFMDDLKKTLRDMVVERVRAAITAKLQERMIEKAGIPGVSKKDRNEQVMSDASKEADSPVVRQATEQQAMLSQTASYYNQLEALEEQHQQTMARIKGENRQAIVLNPLDMLSKDEQNDDHASFVDEALKQEKGQGTILEGLKKGWKKIWNWKKKSKKDEVSLEKSTTDQIVDVVETGGEAREAVTETVEKGITKVMAEQSVENIAQNEATNQAMIQADAAKTQADVGLGIASGSAKTVGELGWWGIPLIAVISAALSALLSAAMNMVGGGPKSSTAKNKAKLVSGMLTYDSGNAQSFRGVYTYDRGGEKSSASGMMPVMGDDGRVYMIPKGDFDHNPLSGYTGMVSRPTYTSVGGQPALVGERGPEMVIGRETTHAMMMSRPDLIKQILEFDRNRSRGFAKTFDSGNLNEQYDSNVSIEGGQQMSQEEMMQVITDNRVAMQQMAEINAQLLEQLRKGIGVRKYGPGGLIEETASGFIESRRLGNNKNITRLFGGK